MQLVLHTPGLTLRVRDGAFEVLAGEERRLISPKQLDSIAVTAGCLLSSAAVELAVQHELSIYFFDDIGDAVGCLRSPYFESLATLRRQQVYFSDSPVGGAFVTELFRQKTLHQQKVLSYLADRRPTLKPALTEASAALDAELNELAELDGKLPGEIAPSLMGWEGNQARIYWQAVAACLPPPWSFERRSRRPAEDGFNAALNYLYGMLYTVVEQAIFAAGLDPHLGILHADEYDRPTLAFDLIEPFRPWVDGLLIEQFIRHRVQPDWFDQRGQGWYLHSGGKRVIIPLFNGWLEQKSRWDGKQLSRRGHIYRTAALLAKQIGDWAENR